LITFDWNTEQLSQEDDTPTHGLPQFDLRHELPPYSERRAAGRALRQEVPRRLHKFWQPTTDRPDPVALIRQSHAGRLKEFLPERMRRMSLSPFAFFRGTANVMAVDLAHTPTTGIEVQLNGDAHVMNFGLYASPQGDVLFDQNDFDESVPGSWEWDLKRLATSVVLAGREQNFSETVCRDAAMNAVRLYRQFLRRSCKMGVVEVWSAYTEASDPEDSALMDWTREARGFARREAKEARQVTNRRHLSRLTERDADGNCRFIENPPVLTHIDATTYEQLVDALNAYAASLTPERRQMLGNYHIADIAHRIGGTGSIGRRCYLALLFGNGDKDPLFLQIKEAQPSVLQPFVRPSDFQHEGRRVVHGQRLIQAFSDSLLGWTSCGGRDFYVRQFKNMSDSIELYELDGSLFQFYAGACGMLLARGHARTGDAAKILGYCGKSEKFVAAIAEFARTYADQVEADFERFLPERKSLC
jgi:uncharacterized protein (DUF2252 family)